MSLLNSSEEIATLAKGANTGAFNSLFKDSPICDASNLILPSSILPTDCYYSLFENCTLLSAAPVLPDIDAMDANTNNCCTNMFANCSNLNSLTVRFTSWPYTTNWLAGVAATGTFTCPAELSDIRGVSNIPEGWTKVDLAS